MLLALTDQFADFAADLAKARAVLPLLKDPYARAYYAGIVAERWAKAHLRRGDPGSGFLAYEAFREAMEWYQKAETLRPPDNADAILRWNACVRILNARPQLQRGPEEPAEAPLE